MSIVSSVIVEDRAQGNGSRKIKEKHTDHLGIDYFINYSTDIGYDSAAALLVHANEIDQGAIDNETNNGIALFKVGGDPLHIDMGGFFNKVVPVYHATWESLAIAVTLPFMQAEDQLNLFDIQHTSRISTNDKKLIWGMDNQQVSDFNTDVQIAIDTKASLDSYISWFDEDGVLK